MDSLSSGSNWEFNSSLYMAAINGDFEPFTDHNQHLDLIVTPIKNTILHIHVTSPSRSPKSTEFVRQILERCPSLLLQVNANGDTPLHVAARYGHSTIVDVLIELAKSPLFELAKSQTEDVESGLGYKQLLIWKSNNEGNSALHEAVLNDYVHVVESLIKEDPEFSHFANKLGETPLFIAAERRCLVSLKIILKRCKSAAHEGPHGMTALHVAVKNNHFDITKELLEKRKSLTMERDQYGWTPLHFATYYGSFSITNLLLDYDTSAAYVADKNRKLTPLHMIVGNANWFYISFKQMKIYSHIHIIEKIISQCPDCCEMVDDRGWNILHFAMTKLSIRHLNTLLENSNLRDLINKKDAKGNTPLHVLATCRPQEYHGIKKKLEGPRYHFAVNSQNDTIHDIICEGSPQLQQEILELSNSDATGPYRRGIISRNPNWIFELLPKFEKTKDSELVVGILIATVTFTAALTMPGGYQSEKGPDQGTAFLSRNAAFRAFVITDATAMVLSLTAVFLHFATSWDLPRLWFYRAYTRSLIAFAIRAMFVAFSTGTYAVLSPSSGFAIATCLIGLSFFFIILCLDAINIRRILRIFRILYK